MKIRELHINDTESFIKLNKKIDDSGYMLYDPGERQITADKQKKAIMQISEDESMKFLVAEIDGALTGYIGAFRGKLNRNKHSAYLVLGVDEIHRGKGIASRLFNAIFAWAENEGVSRLELTVIKENIPAFNLYKKMGFELEGEKVHSLMIDGEPVNEYYLYKMI
ncbi:acetyltransferase [Salinicoccus sediminis]|uniref:Acetyltransferase n=1 Tax=Salinicoccus sediminis TaxID=1432562 RepID=A0A0M2SR14_9STAP|nr:GNAT family N-acetyltransferase [Salinicoccus sediminis]KKK35422.1 acetyltransferase [Salinicoccus sediminis]